MNYQMKLIDFLRKNGKFDPKTGVLVEPVRDGENMSCPVSGYEMNIVAVVGAAKNGEKALVKVDDGTVKGGRFYRVPGDVLLSVYGAKDLPAPKPKAKPKKKEAASDAASA